MSVLTFESPQARLWVLTVILFISYLCVGAALPIVPVFVTETLGFSNSWAGLGVGIAFFSTIVSRGWAGKFSDSIGSKTAVKTGLCLYLFGALVSLMAGQLVVMPVAALVTLLAGRLLLGLGESLVAVGVISWGIGLVGPARSGHVLALVGAALYGAVAVGGPLGLALFDHLGFSGAMLVCAILPTAGLATLWRMEGVAIVPGGPRPSLARVIRRIGMHGSIIYLQGVGFALIGAFFSLYFRHQHWGHAGLGLTAFGGGFVLVRLLFGHLPDKVGGLPVATASLAVETIGQFLLWNATTPTWALLGAFLTGTGCSMIYPAMGREVVRLVEPHLRGTALGGFSAFQDLAYGLTGPLAGLVADHAGYNHAFLIGACAAAIGFMLALLLRRSQAFDSTAKSS